MHHRSLLRFLIIIFAFIAPQFAKAQEPFPSDRCAVIVAVMPSIYDAQNWVIDNNWEDSAIIYPSSNGMFSIGVDIIPKTDAPFILQRSIDLGKIPHNAYCSDGERFLQSTQSKGAEPFSPTPLQILDADFDARPLSRAEKRFLQAALTHKGYYNGLIDGAWGRGSQSALESLTQQEFGREPLNADAAFLTLYAINIFVDNNWEYHYSNRLAVSTLLPMNIVNLTFDSGPEQEWESTDGGLSVIFDSLNVRDMMALHTSFFDKNNLISTPYSLRETHRWVTSFTLSSRVKGYARSDLINGAWTTILIVSSINYYSSFDLISASIKIGEPNQIFPDEQGFLLGLVRKLGLLLDENNGGNEYSSSPNLQVPEQNQQSDKLQQSSGTGFFVNDNGYMLTNAHVVNNCDFLTVDYMEADIVSISQAFDLAVVRPKNISDTSHLMFSYTDAGLNADITIAGFPLHGLLGGLNVSRGSVSAMTGLGGDETNVQISAPVQPGNSGGPVIDRSGNLVGVVVAKLDAVELANLTGDIAQNVNFAIRASMAKSFLKANDIHFEERPSDANFSPEQIATMLQSTTKLIQCGNY